MKARWVEGLPLQQVWASFRVGEPFEAWAWWEAMERPFGAVLMENRGEPVALWPLALRKIGPLRAYRQPIGLPWSPLLVRLGAGEESPSLEKQASVLRALAAWIQAQPAWVEGGLPPQWQYLPALRQGGLWPRVVGSFVLQPGAFVPSADLRRKLRQAAEVPLLPVPASEAYSLWQAHKPKGVSAGFAALLQRWVGGPFLWRAWVVGQPPEGVGLFLWGKNRAWYIAGAHWQPGQAFVRLIAHAIQTASQEGKAFDFMGSYLPGIERFFRQFGGAWENRLWLRRIGFLGPLG